MKGLGCTGGLGGGEVWGKMWEGGGLRDGGAGLGMGYDVGGWRGKERKNRGWMTKWGARETFDGFGGRRMMEGEVEWRGEQGKGAGDG